MVNENFAVLLRCLDSCEACREDGEGEVVEPLLGNAVTISISSRLLSHGTATYIPPCLFCSSLMWCFFLFRIYQQNQYLVPVMRAQDSSQRNRL